MRLLLLFLLFASAELLADPKSHYMIHCMGCHLMHGTGQPPDVPVLDEGLGKLVDSQAGRAYLVRVPGAAQAPIDNAELAEVINWMLNEYSARTLPEDFSPFTEKEVGLHRSQILADPVKFKETLTGKQHGTL